MEKNSSLSIAHPCWIGKLAQLLHHYLIWLLLGSYAVAAFAPAFGLWMRDVSIWRMHLFQGSTNISVPMLLLAFLLLNAGLGIRIVSLRKWLRSGVALTSGIIGNLFIPLLYIVAVSQLIRYWHNPEEVQNILVGLALVASMPIAGSSTAWSQNANGDMTVSLGLVLLSTFLSPLTTPIVLNSVALVTSGDYSQDLQGLAGHGTGVFLILFVLLPSLAGIAIRAFVGDAAMNRIKPYQKVVNTLVLLLLSYSNASVSLPAAVQQPDPDFLFATLGIVTALCVIGFLTGWAIARAVSANQQQEAALMFGLGMNNNGTGLVLASVTLADHPLVMLPIIFYNLVQHLIAGSVDYLRYRSAE
jgi:bile acid:Na+ symporter, BASS family